MTPVKGEPLGVVCNWPPALEAALQRWGTTQAKCPCLTALDVTGKPVYTLTYGELSPGFRESSSGWNTGLLVLVWLQILSWVLRAL